MTHADDQVQAYLDHLNRVASGPLEKATGAQPQLYWHEGVAKAEDDLIWRQDWVCPGLAAEIANTGDYMTFTIAGEPIFSIRDSEGRVRTYANVCRHRMMQLVEGRGHAKRVVCPYHAWTYNLDGQLIGAPYMDRTEDFKKSDNCLSELRTEIWNGWIYVTLNDKAQPVAEALAPLDDLVSRYGMADYVPVLREEHVWQTNWKLLCENFMEGYHLPVAHKETVGAWFKVNDTVFPDEVFDNFTYQTFGKTGDARYGVAHPDNTALDGVWRETSIMPTVFPAHMYVLAPDHLWYLSLRPKGVGEVHVRFGVAIAPEVDKMLSDPGERAEWIDELVTFFGHVNTEDREVVEGIYAGSRSGFAAPGPLSWLEREIHDFQKYLARRLAAYGEGTTG